MEKMSSKILTFDFPNSSKNLFLHTFAPYIINPYMNYEQNRIHAAQMLLLSLVKATEEESEKSQKILHLIQKKRCGERIPIYLIHDFPVEDMDILRKTPKKIEDSAYQNVNNPQIWISEWAMIGWNTLIGQKLIHKKTLQKGLITTHVCPLEGMEYKKNHASINRVPIHTEGSYLSTENMIENVTLLTLKNFSTSTTYVDLEDLFYILQQELQSDFPLLFSKRFCFFYRDEHGLCLHHSIGAIIEMDDCDTLVRWRLQENIQKIAPADPKDTKIQRIIELVSRILKENEKQICTHYGDLLCMENSTGVAHGRQSLSLQDYQNFDQNRYLLRQQSQMEIALLQSLDTDFQSFSKNR